MLKQLWTAILDLIYPPKCPVCHKVIGVYGQWCAKCLTSVLLTREINMFIHKLVNLDTCYAVCDYEAGLKGLLHDMKFRQKAEYARHLRWLLYKGLEMRRYKFDCDLVIPVPLHQARLEERGYNQTALLFKEWAALKGFLWGEDILIREKATQPQWQLKLAERRQNIKGAFKVTRPEKIAGKRILLVDDIFTSGTTMDECAKVLKKAGAAEVVGLVLASGAQ
ncbi:MAG: ComF family protein [Pelosinus sp.]|nr:ComF family protein [Pelosinus sp.]